MQATLVHGQILLTWWGLLVDVGGLMAGFAELGRHGGIRMATSPASPRNVGVSRADWPTPAQRGWKTCLRSPMVYRRLLMTWGNATM